jgi:hypothetical protein
LGFIWKFIFLILLISFPISNPYSLGIFNIQVRELLNDFIIEIVNSFCRGTFGHTNLRPYSLKSMKYRLQVKEIKIIVTLYNFLSGMNLFYVLTLVEKFNRAVVSTER